MAQTATPPTAAQKPADDGKAKSEYHILKLSDGDAKPPTFTLVALNVEAASQQAAVLTHAKNAGAAGRGTYFAVPSRSWKALPVSVETVTVLKIGAAT